MSELAQRGFAFAACLVALFGGVGLVILCVGSAVAANINAEARLREAKNAARSQSQGGDNG